MPVLQKHRQDHESISSEADADHLSARRVLIEPVHLPPEILSLIFEFAVDAEAPICLDPAPPQPGQTTRTGGGRPGGPGGLPAVVRTSSAFYKHLRPRYYGGNTFRFAAPPAFHRWRAAIGPAAVDAVTRLQFSEIANDLDVLFVLARMRGLRRVEWDLSAHRPHLDGFLSQRVILAVGTLSGTRHAPGSASVESVLVTEAFFAHTIATTYDIAGIRRDHLLAGLDWDGGRHTSTVMLSRPGERR